MYFKKEGQNMSNEKCCGTEGNQQGHDGYETVRIKRIKAECSACENYAKENSSKAVAVMCCEGGCLRGEIARRATNLVCFNYAPEKTVRICLGGAFTKDTGQRNLVRNASRVLAVEGCFLNCASRMMQGVLPELKQEAIIATNFYEVESSTFGINEMSDDEINSRADAVARKIVDQI
jgi:uncharacterized metal-binding protein